MKFHTVTVICISFFLWMACTEADDYDNYDNNNPLSNALSVVDSNPQEALTVLEGISNPAHLYEFNWERYMQYVVIQTQARYMDNQNITGDSLILEAERYFAQQENYEMATRASYYAAAYWYEKNVDEKSILYRLKSFRFAEQAGNILFMAKSAYWLSTTYYNQQQWEIAEPYCQKAWTLYDQLKITDSERYKLSITNMLGNIYLALNKLDQSWDYFDDGLKAAQKQNNSQFESRFLRDKGLICQKKKEYSQAKDYFALALSKQPPMEDKLRVYLSFANLYRQMNRPDSTIYYLDQIKAYIPIITYPITRRSIYQELADYYENTEKNATETARYVSLAYKEDLLINQNQNDYNMQIARQQIEQLMQNKQNSKLEHHRSFSNIVFMISLMVIILIILVAGIYWWRDKYKELREQQMIHSLGQHRLLMAGMRSVAKGMDDLVQNNLNHEGSMAWEEMQTLREEFKSQIVLCTKEMLKDFHNGKIASQRLSRENLCFIFLSYFTLSEENIAWMMGQQDNKSWYINRQKEEIRQILTELKVKGIKQF